MLQVLVYFRQIPLVFLHDYQTGTERLNVSVLIKFTGIAMRYSPCK